MPTPPKNLIVLLLAILVGGLAIGAAPAQKPTKVELIVTANSSHLFPVTSLDPALKDAAAKYEEELAKAKKARKDALLVEAGNFVSIRSEQETAYNYPSLKFFEKMEYDVVNLSPRDAVLSMTTNYGFTQSPDKYRANVITALESANPGPLGFPAGRRVEAEKKFLRFVNVSDPATVAGLSGKIALMQPLDPRKADDALADARAQGDVVVAIASAPAERVRRIVAEKDAAPHLLIDFSLPSDVDATRAESTWIIPAPAGGEIFSVELEIGADNSLAKPKIERSRALTADRYASLIQTPKPGIGLGIPNLDSVVSDYFQMKADSTRIDRVDAKGLEDLTSIADPKVYHVTHEGKPCRLYRVFFHLQEPEIPEQPLNGWPRFDYLVLLDDQSNLLRVYNRTRFPVGGQDTTLNEALAKLTGKAPDTWQPDPRLTAGIEELWQTATAGLRQTIELDQKLYGPGGPYSKAR